MTAVRRLLLAWLVTRAYPCGGKGSSVSLPGEKSVRGHLRLAYTPAGQGATSRGALLLRCMLVFLRIAWVNLVAVVGAVSALAPLLARRRPVVSRASTPRKVPARVIPFAAKRAQHR